MRPFARCTRLVFMAFVCLASLTGCSKKLVDTSASVSGDGYWYQTFTVSSNSKISVDLNASSYVDCFLMNESQFSSFQSAMQHRTGMIHINFMADMSRESTRSFTKSAIAPPGTWTFVVMVAHSGMINPTGSADFTMKIDGTTSASAGIASTVASPDPPPSPSIATPRYTPPSPNFPQPATPVVPQRPPMKLTFATLEEALDMLPRGQPPERHAALSYLATQDVVAGKRKAVFSVLLPMLNDSQYQREVRPLVLKWADKDDAPELRTALQSMLARDPANLDPAGAEDALALAKLLLSYKDDQAVASLMRLLQASSVHNAAREMLLAQGVAVEAPLLDALAKSPASNTQAMRAVPDYLSLLSEVGTEKSIEPLQTAMSAKDAAVAKAAGDALTGLADRLKLKPDQYLFNLFNHYTVDTPVGFTLDTTMTQPNTRRWVRQAPNRAVKSTYTVQVSRVSNDYQLASPPNASTIQVGPLVFRPLDLPPPLPQFTQGSHVAALDGTYLIDVVAIVDTTDKTSQTNVTNALKKIKAK